MAPRTRSTVEHLPLYGIIAMTGKEWTVVFNYVRKSQISTETKSLTGCGDFPFERFPNIPVVDWRTCTKYISLPSVIGVYPYITYGDPFISLEEYLERAEKECGCIIIRPNK